MNAYEEVRQLLIDNPVNLQSEGVEHPYARFEVVFLRDIRKGKTRERVTFGPTFTEADKADSFFEQKQRKVKGVIIYDNSRKFRSKQELINF